MKVYMPTIFYDEDGVCYTTTELKNKIYKRHEKRIEKVGENYSTKIKVYTLVRISHCTEAPVQRELF